MSITTTPMATIITIMGTVMTTATTTIMHMITITATRRTPGAMPTRRSRAN